VRAYLLIYCIYSSGFLCHVSVVTLPPQDSHANGFRNTHTMMIMKVPRLHQGIYHLSPDEVISLRCSPAIIVKMRGPALAGSVVSSVEQAFCYTVWASGFAWPLPLFLGAPGFVFFLVQQLRRVYSKYPGGCGKRRIVCFSTYCPMYGSVFSLLGICT
jgi:hypothetical protein